LSQALRVDSTNSVLEEPLCKKTEYLSSQLAQGIGGLLQNCYYTQIAACRNTSHVNLAHRGKFQEVICDRKAVDSCRRERVHRASRYCKQANTTAGWV
jgi:hypothetical protein